MEARLHAAGWESAALDPYDERYYRDWSHETPPLRFPGHFLELDLHHAITPVTGRLHFDPAPLFAESLAVPGTPFRVLSPHDQVLHACVHCFQDGDLALRVREIADIDGLLRSFADTPGFWPGLVERARELDARRGGDGSAIAIAIGGVRQVLKEGVLRHAECSREMGWPIAINTITCPHYFVCVHFVPLQFRIFNRIRPQHPLPRRIWGENLSHISVPA